MYPRVGAEIKISMLLLKSLSLDPCFRLLYSRCSLAAMLLTNNGITKGHDSNLSSFYINSSLTYLLSSPHQKNVVGMEMRSYLIFGRTWIDNAYMCVYKLALVGTIQMMKCISKFSVENRFNNI